MLFLTFEILKLTLLLKIAISDLRSKSIYVIDLITLFLVIVIQKIIQDKITFILFSLYIFIFICVLILNIPGSVIGKGDFILSIPLIINLASISRVQLWLNLIAIISCLNLVLLLSIHDKNLKIIRKISIPFAPHLISGMYLALLPTNL